MDKDFVFRKESNTQVLQKDSAMQLIPLTNSSDCASVDIVATILDGLHSKRVNRRSVKAYYITSGTAEFRVNGSVEVAESGDVFILNKDIWCEIKGNKAKMIVVCVPAFSSSDEEKV